MKARTLFSREEMLEMNIQTLKERTVTVEEIAEVAYRQQSKWSKDISLKVCVDSVEKILSLRDTFHLLQLGAEIDRLTDERMFKGPILDILSTDLGMFGIDSFTAIINPPDACILAVGGISQEPVVKGGQVVPGNVMNVTLSCDHRVVDGATGSAFLQTLKRLLEEPLRMFL